MKAKFPTISLQQALMGVLCLAFLLQSLSCNRTAKGAAIGAAAGGLIGILIADGDDNAKGVLIGATIGGMAGSIIGSYMDKQAKKLKQDLGKDAKVERVGESILVTFDSGILFDVDSYGLKAKTRETLDNMTETINEYNETELVIMGHTDNTGSHDHNQDLSENRARSVSNYLRQKGISSNRLTTKGLGETKPVSNNTSASGRQLNRRVEIAILANRQLQDAARRGENPKKR
jgi:outer membrane protein OmpA-like peptidoglycan-associated protein